MSEIQTYNVSEFKLMLLVYFPFSDLKKIIQQKENQLNFKVKNIDAR